MDKNSVIGLVLIGAILLVFTWFSQPSDEEKEVIKARQDSIALVQQEQESLAQDREKAKTQQELAEALSQPIKTDIATPVDSGAMAVEDSLKNAQLQQQYGAFSAAFEGNTDYFTIENEKLRATISTKGGQIVSVELKDYVTYTKQPLLLFEEAHSKFNLKFWVSKNLELESSEFYFTPVGSSFSVAGEENNEIRFRLEGASPDQYIEYVYGLKGDSYQLDFDLNVVGLDGVVDASDNLFELDWSMWALKKEKGLENERNATTVYFKYNEDEPDYVSERSYDEEELEAKIHWVSMKQQFFSAAIIADDVSFSKVNGKAWTEEIPEQDAANYTKSMAVKMSVPLGSQANPSFPMTMYLGPNHFQTLEALDIQLEDQIDLGWAVFAFVNEWAIIPIFNFLENNTNLGYGMIILILTILIKMVLFPLTYKNYLSSAKMKVLKPDIEEITEKFKDNPDPLKKQQATMALYKKAGVNPMAGCIPMVLQLPILYALFRFFPSSIELRQEGFLWADDLSSYDSIYELGFEIPYYGDHISLFTLLMAISTFFYTKYNMQMSGGTGQLPQMKIMIYFMPVMLLAFFNNYSAGLSYYYLMANVITMSQQFVVKRFFINEDAIRAKINANKKKPSSNKKSGFQKRLEDLAKKRGVQTPKK